MDYSGVVTKTRISYQFKLKRLAMRESNEPEPEVETIELDQFLKLAEVTQSGGQAKHLIQSGAVLVNGMVETRRGKKLRPGDCVTVAGEEFMVGSDSDDESDA